MAEELSYNDLRNRQKKEDKPGLTRIDPGFYARVRERIAELRDEYEKAHAEDPSQQRTMVLLDEINKMEETLEELYHLRERKIVLAAVARARGGSPEVDNLTPVEKDLFDSLLTTLREQKERTLQGPRPVSEEGRGDERPAEPTPDDGDASPDRDDTPSQDPDVPDASEEAGSPEGPAVQRVLVRVLEDLDPFVATDMETYELAEDEVANLPVEQARVLCRRGKAVELAP